MKNYLRFVYSIWSRIYDHAIDKLFYFNRSKLIKALKLKRNDRILEIGVGTGLNLPHYPAGVSVTGIDFSKSMLSKAKQKKTKAKIILKHADAAKLPSKVNSFDKALATYVLRVAPNPKSILKEVARVTKRRSKFVVLDQFKSKKLVTRSLTSFYEPIQLILGWGRNYDLEELIKDTPWKVRSRKKFGKMPNTRIVILENRK